MRKIQEGATIPQSVHTSVDSKRIYIPHPAKLLHLQFRRFAGCPFCSLHLHSFVARYDELAAAGIDEAVVFRSTGAALRRHHPDVPFAVIPDPRGKLYAEFGVGSGLGALGPRTWKTAIRGVAAMLPKLPGIPPWGKGALGLPADFLLDPSGRVLACKYGTHAYDQWSVDELLALAHLKRTPPISKRAAVTVLSTH